MSALVRDLETVYLALLSHPHDLWRIQNQAVYCTVRDALANLLQMGVEEVQNTYEEKALFIKMGKAITTY